MGAPVHPDPHPAPKVPEVPKAPEPKPAPVKPEIPKAPAPKPAPETPKAPEPKPAPEVPEKPELKTDFKEFEESGHLPKLHQHVHVVPNYLYRPFLSHRLNHLKGRFF